MDETPTPREAGRLPLAIETVRWDRTSTGILLRVAGQWSIEAPRGLPAPALLLGDSGEPQRFEALGDASEASARAAKGRRPFRAAFALSAGVEPLLAENVRLDLGFGSMPLPDPEPPEGEAHPRRKVVDSAELAERRARRAEAAQTTAAQRAQEAEAQVEALEIEMAQMEVRLRELQETPEATAPSEAPGPAQADPPPGPAPPPSPLAADLVELRRLVGRAERAASAATASEPQRSHRLERETELAHAAPATLLTHPLRAPGPTPPAPGAPAGRMLEAERRQLDTRTHGAGSAAVEDGTAERLGAELAVLKAELANARAAIADPPADVASLERELEHQREAGRRLAAGVAQGALELRDALIDLTTERDEARRRAERLQSELERTRRGAEAREKAWDAATELAREAVAAASQAVDEAEARSEVLERDLADGATSLERAHALIAELRAGVPDSHESPSGVAETSPGSRPDADADAEPVAATLPAAAAPASAAAAPWLGRALEDLHGSDDEGALDLLLELFAAQGAVRELPEPFDLHVPGRDPLRVTPWPGGPARLRPLESAETPARVRLETDADELHGLLTGTPRRRPRVRGSFRARRALRKALGPVPLDLSDLASAGVLPPPRTLYAALVARIHPAWLAGHELVVEQRIDGPRGDRWFVVVRDGRLRLTDDLPEDAERPDASVKASQVAFAHVLSGKSPPAGERITLKGDRLALALLTQWTERARTR
jgi:hypothetical protein